MSRTVHRPFVQETHHMTIEEIVEAAPGTLQAALQRDGLTPTGPARLARYDPPWQPWFMRRNEAQVPVSQ